MGHDQEWGHRDLGGRLGDPLHVRCLEVRLDRGSGSGSGSGNGGVRSTVILRVSGGIYYIRPIHTYIPTYIPVHTLFSSICLH